MLDTLQPMAIGFFILGGVHALFGFLDRDWLNVYIDSATSLIMACIWIMLIKRPLPLKWAETVAVLIGMVAILNTLFSYHLYFGVNITGEIYLSFGIIGIGVVLLSPRFFLAMLIFSIASWAYITIVHANLHTFLDKLMHMTVTCCLSVLLFVSRRKTYSRLEKELMEREATETALYRSEKRYRDLVGSQGEAMIMLDPNRNISFCNTAADELFKKDKSALLGHPFADFFTPLQWELFLLKTEECDKGERTRFEVALSLKDNEIRNVLVTATPMYDDTGFFEGILGLLRDITERKQSEEKQKKLSEQLQHAQKLESLGVLAGGIAHDFNNILMGVMCNADMMLKADNIDGETHECITEIATASKRAAELCRQMLGYSGKGKFVTDRLDLSEVIRDMAHLLEISITKKASIKYQLSDVLPAIEADITQISQVAMNLVTNASESFDKGDGEIILTTNVTHLDQSYVPQPYLPMNPKPGTYVTLEVTDNGCGMSEQTKNKVFDPFFSTKFTGRGLGLAAVLGIVRGHSGVVEVFSEKDKGSTFRVMFPALVIKAVAKTPFSISPRDWTGHGLILLVDDEPTVLRVGTRMLKRMGFEVITAPDGMVAVDIIRGRADDITLVILDQTMPKMSGDEAFREILKIAGNMRVIISSGYSEIETASDLIPMGLAGFLPKPYDFTQLRLRLQAVLEGGQAFDSIYPGPRRIEVH